MVKWIKWWILFPVWVSTHHSQSLCTRPLTTRPLLQETKSNSKLEGKTTTNKLGLKMLGDWLLGLPRSTVIQGMGNTCCNIYISLFQLIYLPGSFTADWMWHDFKGHMAWLWQGCTLICSGLQWEHPYFEYTCTCTFCSSCSCLDSIILEDNTCARIQILTLWVFQNQLLSHKNLET